MGWSNILLVWIIPFIWYDKVLHWKKNIMFTGKKINHPGKKLLGFLVLWSSWSFWSSHVRIVLGTWTRTTFGFLTRRFQKKQQAHKFCPVCRRTMAMVLRGRVGRLSQPQTQVLAIVFGWPLRPKLAHPNMLAMSWLLGCWNIMITLLQPTQMTFEKVPWRQSGMWMPQYKLIRGASQPPCTFLSTPQVFGLRSLVFYTHMQAQMQQGTLSAGRLANVDEVYPSFLAFGLLTGTDANKSSHGKSPTILTATQSSSPI